MITRRRLLTLSGAGVVAQGVLPFVGAGAVRAAESGGRILRLGILEFGTAAWEIAAMGALGLDAAAGFSIEVRRFATNDAGRIAFQAGAVDAIVTDLLWAARVRADGRKLSYLPFSSSEGAVMVPGDSSLGAIADLAGKRLGVAGGPLDKSWLMLQARARAEARLDLARAAAPAFAAPPLLAAKLEMGELDAALLYWTFCARLAPKGFKRLIGVDQMVASFGVAREPALVGYVFDGAFAAGNVALIDAFADASRKTKAALAASAPEVAGPAWAAAHPLMKAPDTATFDALRQGFIAGVPRGSFKEEQAAAEQLYAVLAELGGARLVGGAKTLPADLYWPGAARVMQ